MVSNLAETQRIVLIDDSELDRARVRAALLHGAPERRYRFREASNGREGLDLINSNLDWPIDCVVVDIDMPLMSGLEMLEHLAGEDGYPRIPIIVLTGSSVSARNDAKRALKMGAQDYVTKDAVYPEILFRIVDNAIERYGMVRRLHDSERAADAANVAKSEFIANMSHEIRSPMTAVLGYADLLAARETDPEKAEFLRIIKLNGRFLLEIINDILDVSKIEAGKMEVVGSAFSVHDLVVDVHAMMENRATEKQIAFEIHYDGAIPEKVESDPKRLRQILVNLVGNAIKFTEFGSVRLAIAYQASDSAKDGTENPRIQFEVTDTGIGMTDAQRSRLFQPFSQGDASITQTFGGTGLGLAISQRLAEMLGGTITCQSEEGKGSQFNLTIPIGTVDGSMLVTPAPAEPIVEDPLPRIDCHALVVDDRRDIRYLVERLLARGGAEVSVAVDGENAIRLIEEALGSRSEYDVVLLDMQMPRLDGYQTAVRLREMGFQKPIIAMTADAMDRDMNRCLESGCDAYLSKPIDVRTLLEMVADFTQEIGLDELKHRRKLYARP